MKLITSAIVILAIVFCPVSSLAGDVGSASYGERFAERNCSWCHGPSLQGFATAPRLAGQKPEYTYTQLRSFIYHTRDNPLSKLYMWGAASNHLSPQTARDLALYVSTLNAKAANDGDPGLAATGQIIYQEGIPVSNIPSCVACHGPAAEGFGEIPRLGGLSYHYLKRRLEQWGEGYHAAAAPPMPGVASKLSANEIEALASYLSFVRWTANRLKLPKALPQLDALAAELGLKSWARDERLRRRVEWQASSAALLIGTSLGVLALAVGLVLMALRDSIVFFYTPAEVAEKHLDVGQRFRLGGLVENGSLKHGQGATISFVVTDKRATLPVTYTGVLPDLFREGQGVVAEGMLKPKICGQW